MSTLRESFEHFRDGDFSDEELAHASGLSERALREMLKFGAVKTFRGGKGTGNKRSWKRKALNTSSIARACNLAGLSLPMAARLSVQYLDMYVFQNSDPMLNLAKWEQLGAEHPISRWISDEFAVSKVDPLFDGYIHITDGWLVTVQVGPGKYTDDYADAAEALDMSRSHIAILSPDGTRLKLWQARRTRMRSSDEIKDHYGQDYESFLDSTTGGDRDPNVTVSLADYTFRNPVTRTSINATMAMRSAMRRAMGLTVKLVPDAE